MTGFTLQATVSLRWRQLKCGHPSWCGHSTQQPPSTIRKVQLVLFHTASLTVSLFFLYLHILAVFLWLCEWMCNMFMGCLPPPQLVSRVLGSKLWPSWFRSKSFKPCRNLSSSKQTTLNDAWYLEDMFLSWPLKASRLYYWVGCDQWL
jgi:hypothetical protein